MGILAKKVLKKEDYRFGIIKYNNGVKGICNCGNVLEAETNAIHPDFACDKCGNDLFIDARGYRGERFTVPYLEAERRDNRGFKVKRVNLSIHFKDNIITPIKENLVRTVEFDMVDKVFKVWRKDVLEYDVHETNKHPDVAYKTNSQLFTLLPQNLFLEFVSNDVTRDLFNLTKSISIHRNGKHNLIDGFSRLLKPEYEHLQILANAGIPEVSRFRPKYRSSNVTDYLAIAETKPHLILRVPKFMMTYLREDTSIDLGILKNLQNALKKIDGGKFREIMSVVKDESDIKELSSCLDEVMQIHMDYDYTNIKKLILYLFREIRLTQGISRATGGAIMLRDYIRMSRSMDLEWEKYPRSLKKVHDVVQMNYKMLNQNENSKKKFDLSLSKKSYQLLNYETKKDDLAIILPKEGADLIKEGNELSHCVSSYVEDIMNDKCKIVFLRDKEDIEKPLVTIEVRGFNIRQAKGFGNRAVTEKQKEFIKKWAEEKTLIEAYY